MIHNLAKAQDELKHLKDEANRMKAEAQKAK